MKQRKQIDPGTGILLSPGLHGEGCPGNGTEPGTECCCEECDFYLDCFPDWRDARGEEKPSILVNAKE